MIQKTTRKPVTIAIDFDSTFTADPLFWCEAIDYGRSRGHKFIMVTCRRDTEENHAIIEEFLAVNEIEISVIYTNLGSKIEAVKKRGLVIDIWIDDDPKSLVHGH